MHLADQGKLRLDDPICRHIPDCPKAWGPITIHQLLTHTSGLTDYTGTLPPGGFRQLSLRSMAPFQLLSLYKDTPPGAEAGAKFHYNNAGYWTLGYLIEKVSGEPYSEFLEKRVLAGIGLKNTGYDVPGLVLKNRAMGYSERKGVIRNADFVDMSVPYAAGSLYSTAEDLLLWTKGLFTGKLLSLPSRTAMTTANKGGYGYGVFVNQQHQRQMISHSGQIEGFSTFLAYFPQEKATIVVLRNRDYDNPDPTQISRDLAAILFGEKYALPAARKLAQVDPALFATYVGKYQVESAKFLIIRNEAGQLVAEMTGERPLEIFPESETKFFLKAFDARISFVKNATGVVTHAIIHQGTDREVKKID